VTSTKGGDPGNRREASTGNLRSWPGRLAPEPAGEEFFDPPQNFRRAFGLVDCLAQPSPTGHAVGEPCGKLLHLSFRAGHFFLDQHLEISADHLVAVGVARLVIGSIGGRRPGVVGLRPTYEDDTAIQACALSLARTDPLARLRVALARCRTILLNLAKDPGIRRRRAADHDGVTTSLLDHTAGIFGSADIPVSDHRNLDRLLDCANPLPSRLAAIALLAGASMQGDGAQAAVLGHSRQSHTDDLLLAPSRAEFHRKRNAHSRPHRFKNTTNRGQIPQQAGSAIALDDLLRRTAQIEVDQVKTELLDQVGGLGHDPGIAAKQLRRDRVLVFVEMEIPLGLLVPRA